MQILAATISIDHFKDSGFNYLQEEKEDIATDIGYVLSIIIKIISKWMRFDIKSQFESCIPPPPDQLIDEISNDPL